MERRRVLHWTLAIVVLLALCAGAVVAALHFAARSLKQDILQALGPESSVADVRVGFTSVIVTGVEVPAPKGWPTKKALSAERIVVVPDLRQLVQRKVVVNKLTVAGAYISAVRPKEGGGLKVLPSLLDERKKKKSEGTAVADIKEVELADCVVEVFDTSLAGHNKMRVDAVHGTITGVEAPELEGRMKLDLQGAIRGPVHHGTIAVAGWVEAKKKASELSTRVRNVDLSLFEPYIIQKAKAGIDTGTFNLDLKASVHNNVVNAPGVLTLTGLKLKSGEGTMASLTSVGERALLGALADDEDRITVQFTLAGDLDNPDFSLGGELSFKTAAGMLKVLGLGFEALIRAFFILVHGFG
jgi:hypothetical protein